MPSGDDRAEVATSRQDENGEDQNMHKWFWNTFFADRASAWTAASTVALVIFSGLLWKVSDRANETSIVAQRAFLTNSGIFPIKVVNNQKLTGVNFFVAVNNSGTT